jgi:hypothetical protein
VSTTEDTLRDAFRADLDLEEAPEPAAEETAPDAAPEPEHPSAEQPRDELGRWTIQEEDLGDETRAVLDKYGGDPVKALQALPHALSLTGRQGQELGQIREELQALRASLEEPEYDPQEFQNVALEDPRAAATQAAQYAVQSGDWQPFQAVLQQWREEDPHAAEIFELRLQLAAERQERIQQQQPFQQDHHRTALTTAFATVAGEDPSMNWDALVQEQLPRLGARYGPEMMQMLATHLQQGTVEQKTAALRLLADNARSPAFSPPALIPADTAPAPAPRDPNAAKAQAMVATPGYSPARATPSTAEDRGRALFRTSVLTAEELGHPGA